tara:strand:- start:105 stop:266 length:162 start_codon:yes stop_codon:yes gene_type:complete
MGKAQTEVSIASALLDSLALFLVFVFVFVFCFCFVFLFLVVCRYRSVLMLLYL